MTASEALIQLARLTGRDGLTRRVAPAEGSVPAGLNAEQRSQLATWIDERHAELVHGLLAEAMDCDDVQNPESAGAYLEDRLHFFGDLLTPPQQQRIRADFLHAAESWV